MMDSDEKRIEEEVSRPIVLSERVRAAVDEAESFKLECAEVGKQVDRLAQMLRTAVRFASAATPAVYDRPVRRVVAEVSKNLERALTLVRKCKRQSALRRMMTITTATDFRKLFSLLDASIGDMKWLLTVFECNGGGGGIVLSLPPIASNDPIIAWVWSSIASVQMGQLPDRIEGTNELASLAADNERNKNIIVEEGGIPPLLKLLKEGPSPEAQIAAIKALYILANDPGRVRSIVQEHGVPIIVQALGNSPMLVQTQAASLVARMAENDPLAQEDFARDNAIRPLVTMLSFQTCVDDPKNEACRQSIHSIVQINKSLEKKEQNPIASSQLKSSSLSYMDGSSRAGQYRRERENEKPEVKLRLKIACAEALWMMARGSVSNSRRICETKGLLCMEKMVEKEEGELQLNCLMCIMEITAAAESNADLRRAAFKTNSPAAKAVVDQMLRLINDSDNPTLQIAAIRSIGSLARTFPAREKRVIGRLVAKLGSRHVNVAAEAATSLGKFVCPENFLCMEHSRTVIEFNGVALAMKLLGENEKSQMYGVMLLCYLALHGGSSEALDQARVLTVLEGVDRTMIAQYPKLKELVGKAIGHLNLYHTGGGALHLGQQ